MDKGQLKGEVMSLGLRFFATYSDLEKGLRGIEEKHSLSMFYQVGNDLRTLMYIILHSIYRILVSNEVIRSY
jgi:hypothetical protein